MTGDTKTSVYILNDDTSEAGQKCVACASILWDRRCADKGSVVRVELN